MLIDLLTYLFSLLIRLINKMKDKFLEKFKQRIEYQLDPSNSINYLFDFINKHNVMSVEIDDIYFGQKNSKRFFLCILNCIFVWLFQVVFYYILVFHNWIFHHPNLPDQFEALIFCGVSLSLPIAVMKTVYLKIEINDNLSFLKFIYYLKQNWKRKHQLNDASFKKLCNLLIINNLFVIDLLTPSILITVFITLIHIYLITNSNTWLIMSPFILYNVYLQSITSASIGSIITISILYYKLLYDQINDKIKLICKSKLLTRIHRLSLFKAIQQHNLCSIQLNKMNLLFNLTAAIATVILSLNQLILINAIMNITSFYFNIALIFISIMVFICNFILTYFFSLQIKSAHQSYQQLFSLIKFKFSLPLKWQVNHYTNNNYDN